MTDEIKVERSPNGDLVVGDRLVVQEGSGRVFRIGEKIPIGNGGVEYAKTMIRNGKV